MIAAALFVGGALAVFAAVVVLAMDWLSRAYEAWRDEDSRNSW